MSLFKAREWWEINLNEKDSYDSQSLLIIKLQSDDFQSVLLGNHKGFLRLFSPSSKINDGIISGFQPSNLLLEIQLSFPILQIDEGFLVSGSRDKQLAVLHPRLFSVYSIKKKESNETEAGHQIVTELIYQHSLQHSAHSFALGYFGGVKGRHFICIQSLDGLLSFYEQESFAFQFYLPNFVIPSSFTYIEKLDSFLFLNGYLTIDCYSYESLASASKSKKIWKKWEYNLGESVIGFQTVSKNELTIIVLSERNLYGLSENGNLLFTKRLEYKPLTFYSFLTEENKLIIVVATDAQIINVYNETKLKWSFKISMTPVCVNRISLNQLSGGLLLLSEDGLLQCVYLGTHPSIYVVSPLHESDLDLQNAEAELKDLQNKILSNDLNHALHDTININVKIDKTIKLYDNIKSCDVIITVDAQFLINRLHILIVVDPPLQATPSTSFTQNFTGKNEIISNISVKGTETPWNLEVLIIVSYTTKEGVGKCITKKETLPLNLVFLEGRPIKESQHKLTFTINKPLIDISQFFKEICTENSGTNAIGLNYINSDNVITILAAKFSKRYRLQSESLPSLSLPIYLIIKKLQQQFEKNADFKIMCTMPLPLDFYNEIITKHNNLFLKRKLLEDRLFKETSQYKAILKKVISNFKDTTSKNSTNFSKMLEITSKQALNTMNELEEIENELIQSRSVINALNQMLSILLESMTYRETNANIIKNIFNSNTYDAGEQGCLEMQEAAVSFFLREILTKSNKEKEKHLKINLDIMKDTNKLIKHLSTFIDRVLKNIQYQGPEINVEDEKFFNEIIPAGTKFLNLTENQIINE